MNIYTTVHTRTENQLKNLHCPENNLNLRIKTDPVTDGTDITVCLVLAHTQIIFHT